MTPSTYGIIIKQLHKYAEKLPPVNPPPTTLLQPPSPKLSVINPSQDLDLFCQVAHTSPPMTMVPMLPSWTTSSFLIPQFWGGSGLHHHHRLQQMGYQREGEIIVQSLDITQE